MRKFDILTEEVVETSKTADNIIIGKIFQLLSGAWYATDKISSPSHTLVISIFKYHLRFFSIILICRSQRKFYYHTNLEIIMVFIFFGIYLLIDSKC